MLFVLMDFIGECLVSSLLLEKSALGRRHAGGKKGLVLMGATFLFAVGYRKRVDD